MQLDTYKNQKAEIGVLYWQVLYSNFWQWLHITCKYLHNLGFICKSLFFSTLSICHKRSHKPMRNVILRKFFCTISCLASSLVFVLCVSSNNSLTGSYCLKWLCFCQLPTGSSFVWLQLNNMILTDISYSGKYLSTSQPNAATVFVTVAIPDSLLFVTLLWATNYSGMSGFLCRGHVQKWLQWLDSVWGKLCIFCGGFNFLEILSRQLRTYWQQHRG